jgi:hypothetical protein
VCMDSMELHALSSLVIENISVACEMAREPLTLAAFSNQPSPSSSSHPIVGMDSDYPPAGSVCQLRGWMLRVERAAGTCVAVGDGAIRCWKGARDA